MLSEGRLSKLLPIKADGQQKTVLVEQEGPISYIESTTLTKVFDEDANRCLLLTTDEREKQTRRILTTLAGNYSGNSPFDVQPIILRQHALQRMLKPYPVVVPYAERLAKAMSSVRVETRRAYPQVISMIQASALLHQQQRDIDADGRLVADATDYEWARYLLAVPMARQLGAQISEPAKRFLQRLRRWFPAKTFTKPEAKRKEPGSRSSVYGWIGELQEAGCIEQVEAQRGNQAATLRLARDAPDPEAAAVLPSVEEVCP